VLGGIEERSVGVLGGIEERSVGVLGGIEEADCHVPNINVCSHHYKYF
jgi:hypothetical protein